MSCRKETTNREMRYSSEPEEATMVLIDVDSDHIDHMPVAMAYVPWQYMKDVYEPGDALQIGTIFPELDKPFLCYKFSGGRRA
ncbi:spore coat associated protein CotJA [Anaeromicropila herbilytica]|uniref:Spore coat associated protein JA (CotJA) n=1 Tax=Anaeromicropila herbilytica TaxID=2785025 RepID=A0A7R7EIQ6_9FIRM|nr:spore coat associated protein CotJA [Anaeromicropila herbilytica]BCN29503.1 hypothetical protein bsdtb5_07980 [Anaeromicropila herbilytica]